MLRPGGYGPGTQRLGHRLFASEDDLLTGGWSTGSSARSRTGRIGRRFHGPEVVGVVPGLRAVPSRLWTPGRTSIGGSSRTRWGGKVAMGVLAATRDDAELAAAAAGWVRGSAGWPARDGSVRGDRCGGVAPPGRRGRPDPASDVSRRRRCPGPGLAGVSLRAPRVTVAPRGPPDISGRGHAPPRWCRDGGDRGGRLGAVRRRSRRGRGELLTAVAGLPERPGCTGRCGVPSRGSAAEVRCLGGGQSPGVLRRR